MKADFSPAYANKLGVMDGLEYGTRHPMRDFSRTSESERDKAYFQGLAVGIAYAQAAGLEMRCIVHWDKPGFDTPCCGSKAVALGIAEYPSGTQVINLCERHLKQAEISNSKAGTPQGFPYPWALVPIDWL